MSSTAASRNVNTVTVPNEATSAAELPFQRTVVRYKAGDALCLVFSEVVDMDHVVLIESRSEICCACESNQDVLKRSEIVSVGVSSDFTCSDVFRLSWWLTGCCCPGVDARFVSRGGPSLVRLRLTEEMYKKLVTWHIVHVAAEKPSRDAAPATAEMSRAA